MWPKLPLRRVNRNRGVSVREESPRTQPGRRPDSLRNVNGRPTRREGRGRAMTGVSGAAERYIAGVPARIMRPRLVFLACLFAILGFGLLMVYSASSVEAAAENGSSIYFLWHQALYILSGLILAYIVARKLGDAWFDTTGLWFLYGFVLALLGLVMLMGSSSRGATRWINLGFMTLQPSEFLKPVVVCMTACFLDRLYRPGGDANRFVKNLVALLPSLILVFFQPDFGTVAIIVFTFAAMLLYSNVSWTTMAGVALAVAALVIVAFVAQPYRMMRFFLVGDPWADEFGDGYQTTLAIMAFASGGLFGRGIGNSTMKYNYLPEAHNDYILAIIGEECGFVGTVLFFIVFGLMIFAAIKIAQQAVNRRGALIAAGSATILAIQFLINALGILNVMPMTGKPLPFVSYGGSSMWASLILAGLILRVSNESARKDEYERRREGFAVMDESTAGTPHVRGASGSRSGFSVLAGSAQADPSGSVRPHARVRSGSRVSSRPSASSNPYGRVDLNSDPSARLRDDSEGPTVRRDYRDR